MAKMFLLDLEDTGMVGSIKGQKIYLYGPNDTGKTFQSMKLPKPLLLMAEAGGNAVRGKKYPVTKWSVFKDLVSQLTSEKMTKVGSSNDDEEDEDEEKEDTKKVNKVPMYQIMQEKYQTIVIDTVENLVEFAEQATCQEFGVRDLSEITGKQNGYAIYRKDFKTQINKLCSYGYTVVFIGHEEIVEKTDELSGDKYTFLQPKGSDNVKASTRFVRDLCDFCMYLKPNGIDENGDTIPSTAICKQTRNVFARSRYAIQTFIKVFNAKNLEEAVIKAIEKTAEDEGSVLSDWEMKNDDYTREDWLEVIKPYFQAIHKKHPERVKDIVASELGEGVKVSETTDEQLTELENIYNQMVTFACDQGIIVDV